MAYADAHKHDLDLCYSILEKCKPHLHPSADHGAMITHREASVLLACENKGVNDAIKKLAHDIKQAYYGDRIVLVRAVVPFELLREWLFVLPLPREESQKFRVASLRKMKFARK